MFNITLAVTRDLMLVVLCPKVQEVLANVGKAANLTVLTVYGGTPYEGQETMLRRVRGRGGRGPCRRSELGQGREGVTG